MFNKILKNKEKTEEERIAKIQIRITDVVNKVGKILEEEKVSFEEMADILSTLRTRFDIQIFKQLRLFRSQADKNAQERDAAIERSNKLIEQYDWKKPK